jgi:glycosyltransferase involved in cell wall biosynthesis
MRICYLVSEYFQWGQFGGYGAITRSLAKGLAERGHQVFVLVPKRTEQAKRSQRDFEQIEGVSVVGLPHSYLQRLRRRSQYRLPRADVYVSVDARFDSWMAMQLEPRARHCIWFLDPMDFDTFWSLHHQDPAQATSFEKLRTRVVFTVLQRFGRAAVKRADALLSQPRQLSPQALAVFGVKGPVRFAPNPIELPRDPIEKAERPLVLFLGRFDWQKQPETFFSLATRFPKVDFVAAGAASDAARDAELRRAWGGLPNLELPGLVSGPAKERLLSRAWILCNTSLREGLPRSFQEALAHRCAIVSAVDPDSCVSCFGYHAADRDFERGLRSLLENQEYQGWRELGRAGQQYIRETHEREHALHVHESIYQSLVDQDRPEARRAPA